jgi:hypothetical protein
VNDQQTHTDLAPATFSGLALIAFLLAILSLAACAIPFVAASQSASLTYAVFAMPAIGLAAAITAFLATRRISRSNGLMGGRPLALFAMFVGLAVAILQGSFVLGAVRTVAGIRTALVPVVHEFVLDAAHSDPDGARALLSPATSAQLHAGALRTFADQLSVALGQYQRTELNTADVLAAAAAFRARANPAVEIPAFDARPVVLVCADARAIAYAFLDEDALNQNTVLLIDLLVILPDTDRAITLVPDGPASQVAAALSLATTGSP